MRKSAVFLLAGVLLALCACRPAEEETPPENSRLLYFLVPEDDGQGGDRLQGSYELLGLPEEAPLLEEACAVVERLLRGPADGELESPIPIHLNVELVKLEIRDRRAYVDFSSEFRQLNGVELVLADYCLTLSLTGLEGISAVSVTAGGRSVAQQPKQIFYERDVLLSTMDDVLQTVEVTLYFLNNEGILTGEKRTIELYEGQTLAENLIAALLEGPQNRELSRAAPEDFQVNFVKVENGICTLNVSASSIAALPDDERAQQMVLWSIADSLYSIEAVEGLRILADGEELQYFKSVPVESVASRPEG